MTDPWAIEHTDPLVGWRIWRIRRLDSLDDERPLRLAAAGRLGIPKFWEPQTANRAVCSNYRTRHEAPWPGCRCGIYGFKERERAERALHRYARDDLSGWALGRVSLWGRIVDSEHGWRAEYAYPYDLVVFTRNRRIPRELRDVYAVDVSVAEAPPKRPSRTRKGASSKRPRAGAALDQEEWFRTWQESVAEAMRVRVESTSRVTIRRLSVSRKLWDAQS